MFFHSDTNSSHAHFTPQEREELQKEGDELDAKIQKAEKEIRALENTLSKLTAKNDKLRIGFQAADTSSADMGTKQVSSHGCKGTRACMCDIHMCAYIIIQKCMNSWIQYIHLACICSQTWVCGYATMNNTRIRVHGNT